MNFEYTGSKVHRSCDAARNSLQMRLPRCDSTAESLTDDERAAVESWNERRPRTNKNGIQVRALPIGVGGSAAYGGGLGAAFSRAQRSRRRRVPKMSKLMRQYWRTMSPDRQKEWLAKSPIERRRYEDALRLRMARYTDYHR